jgi:hypothetical protein
MQTHVSRFLVTASPAAIWAALHPPRAQSGTGPQIIESGQVRIEILEPGDAAGKGLVRTCEFPVPRWLLSGGTGRSWEVITESRVEEFSSYVAISKPLWSRAEGQYRIEDAGDGNTAVTFTETYRAFNKILDRIAAPTVHKRISADNDRFFTGALSRAGKVEKVQKGSAA